MKKVLAGFMLMILLVAVAGVVYAAHMHGVTEGTNPATTNIEDLKKFQKETLSLRDELITKRLELQNEYNKPQKDFARIAALKKEIVDIRTKIEAAADKYGIKDMRGLGMGMMRDGMMGMKRGMMGGAMNCPCPMCE